MSVISTLLEETRIPSRQGVSSQSETHTCFRQMRFPLNNDGHEQSMAALRKIRGCSPLLKPVIGSSRTEGELDRQTCGDINQLGRHRGLPSLKRGQGNYEWPRSLSKLKFVLNAISFSLSYPTHIGASFASGVRISHDGYIAESSWSGVKDPFD